MQDWKMQDCFPAAGSRVSISLGCRGVLRLLVAPIDALSATLRGVGW